MNREENAPRARDVADGPGREGVHAFALTWVDNAASPG